MTARAWHRKNGGATQVPGTGCLEGAWYRKNGGATQVPGTGCLEGAWHGKNGGATQVPGTGRTAVPPRCLEVIP